MKIYQFIYLVVALHEVSFSISSPSQRLCLWWTRLFRHVTSEPSTYVFLSGRVAESASWRLDFCVCVVAQTHLCACLAVLCGQGHKYLIRHGLVWVCLQMYLPFGCMYLHMLTSVACMCSSLAPYICQHGCVVDGHLCAPPINGGDPSGPTSCLIPFLRL